MKYALITGASSGCGYEYARILAQKGYNLLIVSNEEAIHDKAQILRKDYTVEVYEGQNWVTVADISGNFMRKRNHTFCKTLVEKIRVTVTDTCGDKSARITEIRASLDI